MATTDNFLDMLPEKFKEFEKKSRKYLQRQKDENICYDKRLNIFAMTKVENICNDKKLKIFVMTKSWKYLRWQKFENIWNDKCLKKIARTKSRKYLQWNFFWKYLQWQKVENICNDKKLKIFGGQTVAVLLGHSTDGQHLRGISWLQSNYFFFKIYNL